MTIDLSPIGIHPSPELRPALGILRGFWGGSIGSHGNSPKASCASEEFSGKLAVAFSHQLCYNSVNSTTNARQQRTI